MVSFGRSSFLLLELSLKLLLLKSTHLGCISHIQKSIYSTLMHTKKRKAKLVINIYYQGTILVLKIIGVVDTTLIVMLVATLYILLQVAKGEKISHWQN